jgi:ubiquinone/menaquinone biosynthesis C-methylase UbiE
VTQPQDRWAKWLLEARFGGDEDQLQRELAELRPVRDRILDNANIREGDVLLDVGAGDGLVGFGAVDRVGPRGRVVFNDVSAELVKRCTEIASQMNGSTAFEFVVASADDLSSVDDASVDVVTTRSVLIYVQYKDAALRSFHRVLRPGGRISLFEPINKFSTDRRPDTEFWGYDVTAIKSIADKVMAAYRDSGPPLHEHPMFNFDERDLLASIERAGFAEIRLDYEIRIENTPPVGGPVPWDAFYNMSGNPTEPTVREVVERALDAKEAERFARHLRPLVERGEGVLRIGVVYLSAVK